MKTGINILMGNFRCTNNAEIHIELRRLIRIAKEKLGTEYGGSILKRYKNG